MKAAILNQNTYKLEIKEVDLPGCSNTEVIIRLKAASINHHELWTLKEKELKSESAIIMGSDGAGIVEKVGSSVAKLKKGDEVIINPSIKWGDNRRVQGDDYEILGFPTQGCFAEYISIDQDNVYLKPNHLNFSEAAALPLAGLTAYRAIFDRGELDSSNRVLITGIGGGAATFALKFALAAGAEVYVTSGDDNKILKAKELGALGGVNYKYQNWEEELSKLRSGFDVIIDSAAGEGFSRLVNLANPGGRIVLFGRTAGTIPLLDPKIIFWKQLSIHGSTMGSDEEFQQMLNYTSKNKIKPLIDSSFKFLEINNAFEKMDKAEQLGKILVEF